MIEDRIIMTAVFLIFCGIGFLNVKYPQMMFKYSANNTVNKKASEFTIINFKIGGLIFIVVGVSGIVATWMGWLRI